jgi:hypothetical protein
LPGVLVYGKGPSPSRSTEGDQVAPGKIYIATPDTNEPWGGIRQLYRIVDALNEAGLPAAVLHSRPGFRCTWFENDTIIEYAPGLVVCSADLLVLPEQWVSSIPNLAPGVPKVIFNQSLCHDVALYSGANRHLNSGDGGSTGRSAYVHPDVLAALVVSEESYANLRFAFPSLRIERVRPGIDVRLFQPAGEKSPVISYMPRRRSDTAQQVLGLLEVRGALDGWEVVPIEGVGETTVASMLSQARIFLSLSDREGFGLPAAEAMATGCLVIGYTGFGGKELFREHGIAVPDGDVVAFARIVESVLVGWDADADGYEAMAAESGAFVRGNYSIEQQAAEAVRVFRLLRSDSDATTATVRRVLTPFEVAPRPWRRAVSRLKAGTAKLARRFDL